MQAVYGFHTGRVYRRHRIKIVVITVLKYRRLRPDLTEFYKIFQSVFSTASSKDFRFSALGYVWLESEFDLYLKVVILGFYLDSERTRRGLGGCQTWPDLYSTLVWLATSQSVIHFTHDNRFKSDKMHVCRDVHD